MFTQFHHTGWCFCPPLPALLPQTFLNWLPVSISVILFCSCWQYQRKTVIKKQEIAILRIDHLNFSQNKYSDLLKAYIQGREMQSQDLLPLGLIPDT